MSYNNNNSVNKDKTFDLFKLAHKRFRRNNNINNNNNNNANNNINNNKKKNKVKNNESNKVHIDFIDENIKKEIIDFCNIHTIQNDDRIIQYSHATTTTATNNNKSSSNNVSNDNDDGLIRYEGPIYTIKDYPGVFILPKALSSKLQHELAYLSLTKYCEHPHITNIDDTNYFYGNNNNNNNDNENDNGSSSNNNSSSSSMFHQWTIEQKDKQESENNASTNTSSINTSTKKNIITNKNNKKCINKLSWSAMGYHYNWTLRSYAEKYKSYIPKHINLLSNYFVQSCYNTNNSDNNNNYAYTSSACIINYYNIKSIMGGHKDDLEYTFLKPIVSYSLGLPCIFLLGSSNNDDDKDNNKPIYPIYLRSGDIIMLGGSSRLCYHSIPRIFTKDIFDLSSNTNTNIYNNYEKDEKSYQLNSLDQLSLLGQPKNDTNEKKQLQNNNVDDDDNVIINDDDYIFVQKYLSNHRININVRQVLPDGILQIPSSQK